MRTISSQLVESQAAPVRIVGLCTSLANAKDLGEWIGASSHGLYNFPPGMFATLSAAARASSSPGPWVLMDSTSSEVYGFD